MLLVGWQEGHPACKKPELWVAGVVICLERGADLHTAQLMPLPLTVSCFTEIQIGVTLLVPAHPGSPGKMAIKRVCVCSWCCCLIGQCSNSYVRMWWWFIDGEATKTISVRNLSYNVTQESLQEAFHGSTRIWLPKNFETGEPKGWGTEGCVFISVHWVLLLMLILVILEIAVARKTMLVLDIAHVSHFWY